MLNNISGNLLLKLWDSWKSRGHDTTQCMKCGKYVNIMTRVYNLPVNLGYIHTNLEYQLGSLMILHLPSMKALVNKENIPCFDKGGGGVWGG
jgi:hypothetical protein